MRTRLIALLAVALMVIFAPAAQAQSDTGLVTVVHGIPGLTVDVYVNGDLTLEDFEPGTVTGPLELPEGIYDIEIYPADADPDTEDPAIAGSADLTAGANVSLVAHLDADGTPTLSVFANDTSKLDAGEARITVRHTAAAPAVDILANGSPVFEGVENGDEGVADLPAGTIEAAVALAGTEDIVLGPADVDLAEGVNTIIYAVGSVQDDTLDLLVQTIPVDVERPDVVTGIEIDDIAVLQVKGAVVEVRVFARCTPGAEFRDIFLQLTQKSGPAVASGFGSTSDFFCSGAREVVDVTVNADPFGRTFKRADALVEASIFTFYSGVGDFTASDSEIIGLRKKR